ncbi:MAG: hypothetical protein ACP5SQ_10715 [Candidatus Saccharicenans sp.]
MAKEEIYLIVDANALIDLIKLDLLDIICRLPGYRFHLVEEVYEEITWPIQKRALHNAIQNNLIIVESLVEIKELELFSRLSSDLDSGEAASLVYAFFHNCYLLSDENNKAFRREVGRTITLSKIKRTPEILVEAIRLRKITFSEINDRIKSLEGRASALRDFNDVEHFKRILEKMRAIK